MSASQGATQEQPTALSMSDPKSALKFQTGSGIYHIYSKPTATSSEVLEVKWKEILDPGVKALIEAWLKTPEGKKSWVPMSLERCPELDPVGSGVKAWKGEYNYDPMALDFVQNGVVKAMQIQKQIFRLVPLVNYDEDLDLVTMRKALEKLLNLDKSKTAKRDGSCPVWVKLRASCCSFTLRCRKVFGGRTRWVRHKAMDESSTFGSEKLGKCLSSSDVSSY